MFVEVKKIVKYCSLFFVLLFSVGIFSCEVEINKKEKWERILNNYMGYFTRIKNNKKTDLNINEKFLKVLKDINDILSSEDKNQFLKFIELNDSYKKIKFENLSWDIRNLQIKLLLHKNKTLLYSVGAVSSVIVSIFLLKKYYPKSIPYLFYIIFQSNLTSNIISSIILTFGIKFAAEIGSKASQAIESDQIKENFSSVAGATEAKEELQEVVNFLKNPEKYNRFGAKMPKGILLIGEPGNGKTLLAKAVAGEANCPYFYASGSDFVELYIGVGAARIRELFAKAREVAPCIIFLDELDSIGRCRGGSDSSEEDRTLNQLLTEMDGFETSENPIIIIGATNRLEILDDALLRPGRFDKQIHVPYPDLKSREQILKIYADKIKVDDSVDLNKLARVTTGFSGADLANLVNEAAIYASKNQDRLAVTMQDFEQARDKITLGKELANTILSEKERKIVAYHESGHALINLLLPNFSDPLDKVTIIPRGNALGVTASMPEKDKYNPSKDEILARVKIFLGGRAAEELVFNSITTGAYSDFDKASDNVRKMVCLYGMSEKLGYVVYNQQKGSYAYSQKTAELIDEEVRNIIDSCYKQCKKMLSDNRKKLDKLANALLEKETMYASEIYQLLGIKPRTDFNLTA